MVTNEQVNEVPFQMIFAEQIEHDQTEAAQDTTTQGGDPTLPLPGIG